MTPARPRYRVVSELADAYVEACEQLEDLDARAAANQAYNSDAFTTAMHAVRRLHHDLTGDEVLAGEDAVLSMYPAAHVAAVLATERGDA